MNFAKFLDWHGDLCQHNAAFKKEVFRRPVHAHGRSQAGLKNTICEREFRAGECREQRARCSEVV
jgi:hypothetical protein